MTDYNDDRQRFSEAKLRRRSDDRHLLGVDGRGRGHYQDAVLGAIWVLDDGELVWVEATRELSRWIDHIDDQCGWRDEPLYSEKPGLAGLAEDIIDAVEFDGGTPA